MYRNQPQHLGALVFTLVFGLVMHSAGAANPVQAEPAAPLASSFPGPLWEVVAPKGGTASVANAHLLLNVPGGSNHDPLRPSNESVQVVQPIGNQDFDISIKIDSEVVAADAGTSEGLIVLSNDKDFILFALGTDGADISLTARTVTAGVEATLFNEAHFSEYQNPICLRLRRGGDVYTAYYSVDGVVWTEATRFTDTKVPTWVGPFAGNYNSTPAKAAPVVMVVNWFDVVQ